MCFYYYLSHSACKTLLLRSVFLLSEAYKVVLHYFHFISQTAWFSKTLIEYEISVFFVLNCEIFLILWKINWYTVMNINRYLNKVPVILVIFAWNLGFLNRFSKNSQMWNFIKSRPLGAEFFHADTDTWRSW